MNAPAFAAYVVVFTGCGQATRSWEPASVVQRSEPMASTVDEYSLGDIARGGLKDVAITIANNCDEAWHIRRVELSCDCVTAVEAPGVVHPADQASFAFRIDFRDDPEFTGALGVRCALIGDRNVRLYECRLDVEVIETE